MPCDCIKFQGDRPYTLRRLRRTLSGSGDHPHIQRIRWHTWRLSHGPGWGGGYFLQPFTVSSIPKSQQDFLCKRFSLMLLACCSEKVDIHLRGLRPAGMWHHLTGRLVFEVSRQRSRLIFKSPMSRTVTCIFRRQIRKHKTCKIKKQRKCGGTVYWARCAIRYTSIVPQHRIRLADSFTSFDTFLTLANFTP